MPGKPNNYKLLMDFPISSAIPQEKPAAVEALFVVGSISLKDIITN